MKKILLVFMLFLCIAGSVFAEKIFTVEIKDSVPYTEAWNKMSLEEKRLNLFNILTSVSTQKGITYISRTAGYKPKTLFEDSYLIMNPDNKKSRIPDVKVAVVPESRILYAYQKDNRFKGNVYRLDYTSSENSVLLKTVNLTDMKFMGVVCVPKEKVEIFFEAVIEQEGFRLNAKAVIYDRDKEIKVPFYTVDLESSFTRRITALKDWFVDQVNNF
ncbi:MAG: hypothetical protein MJ052_03075 [Sphaerochaetaceae bacterium]|nr:hypothetical protein [Sphaerochaetaceae bacterium]